MDMNCASDVLRWLADARRRHGGLVMVVAAAGIDNGIRGHSLLASHADLIVDIRGGEFKVLKGVV